MPNAHDYWWIWCLFLVVGFGGCIGSFLNVVVYRLPRDIHLGDPLWSFCPNCRTRIRWYDNIPVLSYFRLRGSCRACGCSIPPRYVIIEVITILTFIILFDAFFVASLLNGINADPWTSVAYRFYSDWPIYTAHVLLFASLIAMSAIDMEQYWVDIRFTHLAAACGFVLHAIWTPAHNPPWPRPGASLSAAALIATLAIVVTHLIAAWLWRRRARAEAQRTPTAHPPDSPPAGHAPEALTAPICNPTAAKRLRPSAWLAGLVLAACLTMLITHLLSTAPSPVPHASSTPPTQPGEPRASASDLSFLARTLPAVLFTFAVLVAGSVIRREADQVIEEALEAERHSARRMALTELATLMPAVLVFGFVLLLVQPGGVLEKAWHSAWHWQIGRQTRPILGLGTAAAGFLIAGAVGWAVRIFFTLALGKEAFGTGDIHIMAAAGAVMGWEVVVIGFFMSALLALLGKAVTLPFKRGHALPMGPWITLGLFITLLLREPLVFDRFIEPLQFVFRVWSRGSS